MLKYDMWLWSLSKLSNGSSSHLAASNCLNSGDITILIRLSICPTDFSFSSGYSILIFASAADIMEQEYMAHSP